jgi:hypothetical protein
LREQRNLVDRIDNNPPRPARAPAIVKYALVCLALGAVVTAIVLALIGGADRDAAARLAPVREISLVEAVQHGGCRLRLSRSGERVGPPVDGPSGVPAAPQVYERPPDVERLTGALRHGVVVIAYRPHLDDQRVDELRAVQREVPAGTIVTPTAGAARDEITASAYRRQLGCRRFSPAAIDAVRLFRGRFVGTGPDR